MSRIFAEGAGTLKAVNELVSTLRAAAERLDKGGKDFPPASGGTGRSLLQPGPAFRAAPPVHIAAQMFVAGRASPVIGRIPQEGGYTDRLQPEQRSPGKLPEEIGAFVEHRAQQYHEHRRRNGHDLAVLPRPELPLDLVLIPFLPHGDFLSRYRQVHFPVMPALPLPGPACC